MQIKAHVMVDGSWMNPLRYQNLGVTPVRDRFPLQIEGHGQSDTQSRMPTFPAQTKLPIMPHDHICTRDATGMAH